MSVPNTPIVNAGLKYVNGLQLSAAGGDKLVAVAAGAARDSSDTNDIILGTAVSINGAVVGANGVDVAAVILNKMYAVYVIASSTSVSTSSSDLGGAVGGTASTNPYPTAAILSLSATAPALPYGYDMYRRIGWVATDSAVNIVKFFQYDVNDQVRKYYWKNGASVLSAATGTWPTSQSLAAATAGAGIATVPVPPMACEVLLDVSIAGAATSQFGAYESSAPSQGQVRFASAGAAINSLVVPCQLNSGVQTILYGVSASTVTVLVTGFVDYL